MYFNARMFKSRHFASAYFIKPEVPVTPEEVTDTFRMFKANLFRTNLLQVLTPEVTLAVSNTATGVGSISVTGTAVTFLFRPVEVLGDGTHARTQTNVTDAKTQTQENVAGMRVSETIVQPQRGQAVSWE